jgi:nitroreductase
MTRNERAPDGDRSYAAVRGRLEMPLVEAMETQRAVRKVLPDPVDDDIVVRCIELALRAPTGSNSQSWLFVVVRDADVRAAFAAQYRVAWSAYRERMSRRSPSPRLDKVMDSVQWQVDHFEEIPVLVVPCLEPDSSGRGAPRPDDPPIRASSFYGSVYPSVQNLLLAARAVGLGASLVTLPLWSHETTQEILGLPADVTPVCMVPLGWPRGRYGPTTRRPVHEVIHRDRYGMR